MGEVIDPVCGMALGEPSEALELGARVVEHGGRQLYFCCPHCEKEFLASPEKYVK